jgi:hypothetical protein
VADLIEQPFNADGEVVRGHPTTLSVRPEPTGQRPPKPRPATTHPVRAGVGGARRSSAMAAETKAAPGCGEAAGRCGIGIRVNLCLGDSPASG